MRRGDREIWFLPVARIDTTRPKGLVPHSAGSSPVSCATGRGFPAPPSVQAHRVDVGLFTRLLFRGPLVYCIHTQERGLLGPTSDSFWRFTGGLHERVDRAIARRAARVIVFNPAYAEKVRRWNPRTVSAPTWFDPAITVARLERRSPRGHLGRQARDAEGPGAGHPQLRRPGRATIPTSRGRSR